jgi:hypothetical protein
MHFENSKLIVDTIAAALESQRARNLSCIFQIILKMSSRAYEYTEIKPEKKSKEVEILERIQNMICQSDSCSSGKSDIQERDQHHQIK